MELYVIPIAAGLAILGVGALIVGQVDRALASLGRRPKGGRR